MSTHGRRGRKGEVRWDDHLLEGLEPAWVDAGVNYLGEHGHPRPGDVLDQDEDDEAVFYLDVVDPVRPTHFYSVTLVRGKSDDGTDTLLVSAVKEHSTASRSRRRSR